MGEMFNVVSLGNDFYLEYQNEQTGWQMKTKLLSPTAVKQYEDLMEEFGDAEDKLLYTFVANL